MALSNEKIREYSRRLLTARTRILCNNPFYGVLLMNLKYTLDESCPTAYTDGEVIAFSPSFLEKLSDTEVDLVMMHEILHVALQHCIRGDGFDHYTFNVACDIVVNSNILKSCGMDIKSITLKDFGELMHVAPDKKEGYLYTAEEVYHQLIKNKKSDTGKGKGKNGGKNARNGSSSGDGGDEENRGGRGAGGESFDDHSKWEDMSAERAAELRDVWAKRVKDAAEAVRVYDPQNSRGTVPACAERMLKELAEAKTDWRTVLCDFVQIEINDYSFSPPDRRFDGGDFYLPDFNVPDEKIEKILFWIDTSGSMSDDMIAEAYTEITGAIAQFDGRLTGMLGFFDAKAYDPVPFSSISDVLKIRPRGGGGTDFDVVFDHLKKNMANEPPSCIVILTDGFAPFPDESDALGVPVLWLINNEQRVPPWGKHVVVK